MSFVNISTVAFDFGGVLSGPAFGGLEEYAAELDLPAASLTPFFREDPQMRLLLVGRTTTREFLKYVCTEVEARHGVRVDIRRLGTACDVGSEGITPVMLSLVHEVRERCRTMLITNNAQGAGWRRAFPFELFDHVLDSSELGVSKPDPRIYQELVRASGGPAEEILFIDDFEENLPPAADLGIATMLFTDPESCRAGLAERGLVASSLSGARTTS